MLSARERLLRRAAAELTNGMTVNLGIGLPTALMQFVPPAIKVCVHSENGIAGMGGVAGQGSQNRNLIDAGGNYVTTLAGAAFFDSATSFALVRSGRLHLSVLGAFEVAQNGDLANWIIPGKFTPGAGGAMELAQKARRVLVLTTHLDKNGKPKLLKRCTLPLTAPACVQRIITDLALIDVTEQGFALRELREGVSLDEVIQATDAPLLLPDTPIPYY